MKVADLTGMELDHMVAKFDPRCTGLSFEKRTDHIAGIGDIDGQLVVCVFLHEGNTMTTIRLRRKYPEAQYYSPSTQWNDAGPIIDRERITLDGGDLPSVRDWQARTVIRSTSGASIAPCYRMIAESPLVAAMRAFVASKVGLEILDREAA
jgi:hypothetical protein